MGDDSSKNTTADEYVLATDDGALRFLISDPLEAYRVKTILTKEPETIAWIDSWRVPADEDALCFWDVGANIGIYSLYAAAKHPGAHVLSFEPFFTNFARLKANVQLNRFARVTPVHLALSNTNGIARFGGSDARSGASGNVVLDAGPASGPAPADYTVYETLLQARGGALIGLGIPAPHYLKIDVDGIELDILEGMDEVLRSDRLRSLLVEINTREECVTVPERLRGFGLVPDDRFNTLSNHSRTRRSLDPANTADNWVFTKQ